MFYFILFYLLGQSPLPPSLLYFITYDWFVKKKSKRGKHPEDAMQALYGTFSHIDCWNVVGITGPLIPNTV